MHLFLNMIIKWIDDFYEILYYVNPKIYAICMIFEYYILYIYDGQWLCFDCWVVYYFGMFIFCKLCVARAICVYDDLMPNVRVEQVVTCLSKTPWIYEFGCEDVLFIFVSSLILYVVLTGLEIW